MEPLMRGYQLVRVYWAAVLSKCAWFKRFQHTENRREGTSSFYNFFFDQDSAIDFKS